MVAALIIVFNLCAPALYLMGAILRKFCAGVQRIIYIISMALPKKRRKSFYAVLARETTVDRSLAQFSVARELVLVDFTDDSLY